MRSTGTGHCTRAELRGGLPLERRLLQSLNFGELAGRHLFDQLKNCLGGRLTDLYELHGPKNSTAYRTAESPVGSVNVLLKGHAHLA
jgi:hypothetical protein